MDSTMTPVSNISTMTPTGLHVLPYKHVIDLYLATYSDHNMSPDTHNKTVPFFHPVSFKNPDSTMVQVRALSDKGAMSGAMCSSMFNTNYRAGISLPRHYEWQMEQLFHQRQCGQA